MFLIKIHGKKKWGAGKGKKLPPAMPDKNSNLSTKGHFCACAGNKHCPSVSDIHNSEVQTEKHLHKNACETKIQFIRGSISDIWSINSMLLFEKFNKYFMGSICTKIFFFFSEIATNIHLMPV